MKNTKIMVIILGGLGMIYLSYSLKAALGINLNLLGEGHAPQKLEQATGGLVKCTWFANSHHCDLNQHKQ